MRITQGFKFRDVIGHWWRRIKEEEAEAYVPQAHSRRQADRMALAIGRHILNR